MRHIARKFRYALLLSTLFVVPHLVGVGPLLLERVQAASLLQRSLKIDNNLPDGTAGYEVSLQLAAAGMLGSIKIDFCANSSILNDTCDPPVGFDVSNATLSNQDGEIGFSISPASTANSLVVTRVPTVAAAGTLKLTFQNVHNPTTKGTSYSRYYTYASNDTTGAISNDGAGAFSINDPLGISAEVPPYILLCVATTISSIDCSSTAGNFVQLGSLSSSAARLSSSQLVIATNAANGYTIRVAGRTMTSGNNSIPAMNSTAVSSPGSSQFGINLASNTVPAGGLTPSGPGTGGAAAGYNQSNLFRFNTGEVLAGSNSAEDYRKYTISYLVNISKAQPPGVYSGTFSYIALGNF